MSAVTNTERQTGTILVEHLGLTINKTEGHDLAGPCIECKSSDASLMQSPPSPVVLARRAMSRPRSPCRRAIH